MSEETTNVQPEGKGMAVTGFVLSLVGIVFASIVAGIAALSVASGGSPWLMYVWIILCAASVALSAMGMSKLGKTGGKKGLGIAGLVIGLVALIWSIMLMMGLSAADSMLDDAGYDDAIRDLQELSNELESMQ